MEKHLVPGSAVDSFLMGGLDRLTMNLMDEAAAGVGVLGGRAR